MSYFEKKSPQNHDTVKDGHRMHHAQDTEPTCGGISLSESLSDLQRRCEGLIHFFREADELSQDSAIRLGVPLEDVRLFREATCPATRDDAISRIKTFLADSIPGHTGSFPDYLRYARLVEAYLSDSAHNISNEQGFVSADNEAPNSPERVACDLASLLSATMHVSRNDEQIRTSDRIFDLLVVVSRAILPRVSTIVEEERQLASVSPPIPPV